MYVELVMGSIRNCPNSVERSIESKTGSWRSPSPFHSTFSPINWKVNTWSHVFRITTSMPSEFGGKILSRKDFLLTRSKTGRSISTAPKVKDEPLILIKRTRICQPPKRQPLCHRRCKTCQRSDTALLICIQG